MADDVANPGPADPSRGSDRRLWWATLLVAAAAIALSSCTQQDADPRAAAPAAGDAAPATTPSVVPVPTPITAPTTTVPAQPGKSILPDITVDDVAGGTVNLASLAPSPKPLLLWFWAPT